MCNYIQINFNTYIKFLKMKTKLGYLWHFTLWVGNVHHQCQSHTLERKCGWKVKQEKSVAVSAIVLKRNLNPCGLFIEFMTAHVYSSSRVKSLLQMVPLLRLPQLEPPKERVIICLCPLFTICWEEFLKETGC